MGVFREWQPKYQEEGVATFPVGIERIGDTDKTHKRPLISRYLDVGTKASRQLAARPKFADCNGIGFRVDRSYGPKITVLDIDTTDEHEVDRAIERHGDTPIIIRTASRKYQLYYRHGGEKRLVRPWGEDVPIDLLGAGFVVAVPSVGPTGSYEFLRGSLGNLRNLPKICGVENFLKPTTAEQGTIHDAEVIQKGERNISLWECCMIKAKQVETFDDLLAFARHHNTTHMQPSLSDMEVVRSATSAWSYEERGANYFGSSMVVCQPNVVRDLSKKSPDALALLLLARALHWERERFCLANAMAETLEWTLPRLQKARQILEGNGYLVVLHRGGRGPHDPTQYGWPKVRRRPAT